MHHTGNVIILNGTSRHNIKSAKGSKVNVHKYRKHKVYSDCSQHVGNVATPCGKSS